MKSYCNYAEERMRIEQSANRLKREFIYEYLEDTCGKQKEYVLNKKEQGMLYNIVKSIWVKLSIGELLKDSGVRYDYVFNQEENWKNVIIYDDRDRDISDWSMMEQGEFE